VTHRPTRRRGFTIAEVLITIAIISVAFLGTMAALAFGMTATRDTAQHTTALNYNRRMIELLYNKPSIWASFPDSAPAAIDAPRDSGDWRHLYYREPQRPRPAGLDFWYELSDWYPDAMNLNPSNEAKQFLIEEPKYQVNIVRRQLESTNPTTNPATGVWRFIVTTRWSEKVGVPGTGTDISKWRSMRTEAAYVP
jgi:prepilin-type N-terminal cleavage/methylation domain-containing protein